MQRYIDLYSAKNRHETVNTNVCDHVYGYLNILKFISNYKNERSVHKQNMRRDKSDMALAIKFIFSSLCIKTIYIAMNIQNEI